MPSLTLSFRYGVNDDLVLSSDELKSRYFFGIPIVGPGGNVMSDEDISFYIRAAQIEFENYLQLKLNKQVFLESRDWFMDDWWQWGFVPTSYPVREAISLQGFLNTTLQVDYPQDWLRTKLQRNEEGSYHRKVSLVPISGSPNTLAGNIIYTGIAPNLSYFGNQSIPDYWEVKYVTGFEKVPEDILNGIGKLASINIFHILGDLILGSAGIASQSIGIDGLSQSISSTSSATNAGYGARIIGYQKDLKESLPLMRAKYTGMTFGVL